METQTVRVGGVSKTYGVYKSKEATVASPPPFFQSAVDVLVPFHGQYLKVRNLVESIMLNTKTTRFRVTLIDDGSPNQNFVPDIRKQAPVEHIRLPNRAGFGAALRAGFEATDLPWVCVVHSDAVVGTMDWLARLGQSLLSLKSQNIRMVHARTDNPGGEFLALRPSGQGDAAADAVSSQPLPLVCAMFHRDLFPRIGGFVRPYPTAGYEDIELFHRMKAKGFGQAVCGGCWVRHDAGSTVREVVSKDPSAAADMEANYERCLADVRSLGR